MTIFHKFIDNLKNTGFISAFSCYSKEVCLHLMNIIEKKKDCMYNLIIYTSI